MTRSLQPSSGFESESLQADVMRFMAIIGFCLVAIFALVRNTDARPTPAPESPVIAEAAAAELPVAEIEPALPPIEVPESMPTAVAEPVVEVALAPAAPEAPEPERTPAAEEPGLSLSFTSDRDFLQLLSTGTVELFVLEPTAVEPILRFDPRRNFTPAPAPGRVYELLPGTIPATITSALARQRAPLGAVTWGVKLPGSLEGAIAEQRQRHSRGTLLIDRRARIRHVPSA